MKINRLSKFIIFAMTGILLLLSLLFFVANDGNLLHQLSNIPASVLSKSYGAQEASTGIVTGLFSDFDDLFSVYEDNQQLKATLANLSNQEAVIEELKAENQELRESLGLQSTFKTSFSQPARVIQRSTLSWLAYVTLDKGRDDQVSEQMLVAAKGSLIGTINQLNDDTVQVELVTNTVRRQPIAVKLETLDGPLYGMLTGYDETQQMLMIGQFNRQQTVSIGTKVVTSGLDGTGIQGIPVGEVTAIGQASDQSLLVYVTSSSDFNNLDQVTILGGPHYD